MTKLFPVFSHEGFPFKIFFRVDFCQIFGLLKSKSCHYLDVEARNEKSKTTLISENLKVPENKVVSFFFVFGLSAEILKIFDFD